MLERELEWVRSNPKARQAKSKSRLARYEELAAEAERARKIDTAEINIPPGPRLGDQVLDGFLKIPTFLQNLVPQAVSS